MYFTIVYDIDINFFLATNVQEIMFFSDDVSKYGRGKMCPNTWARI